MRLAGYPITPHALKRALQRQIEPDWITDALTSPIATHDTHAGRRIYSGPVIDVVLAGRTIITVYPRV